jgi:hypothetical protein
VYPPGTFFLQNTKEEETVRSDRIIKGYKSLAVYLNIGVESARKLMTRDDFPMIEISTRVRIIPIDALESWLQKRSETRT